MWALATASIPEEKVTKVSFIGSNRLGRFSKCCFLVANQRACWKASIWKLISVCVCADSSINFYQFGNEGAITRTEVRHLDELEMSCENWWFWLANVITYPISSTYGLSV